MGLLVSVQMPLSKVVVMITSFQASPDIHVATKNRIMSNSVMVAVPRTTQKCHVIPSVWSMSVMMIPRPFCFTQIIAFVSAQSNSNVKVAIIMTYESINGSIRHSNS